MSARVVAILLALVIFITVGMYFSLKRSAAVSHKGLQEAEAPAPPAKKLPAKSQ